jgi:hypothetical protein
MILGRVRDTMDLEAVLLLAVSYARTARRHALGTGRSAAEREASQPHQGIFFKDHYVWCWLVLVVW